MAKSLFPETESKPVAQKPPEHEHKSEHEHDSKAKAKAAPTDIDGFVDQMKAESRVARIELEIARTDSYSVKISSYGEELARGSSTASLQEALDACAAAYEASKVPPPPNFPE